MESVCFTPSEAEALNVCFDEAASVAFRPSESVFSIFRMSRVHPLPAYHPRGN